MLFLATMALAKQPAMGTVQNGYCEESVHDHCAHKDISISVVDQSQLKAFSDEFRERTDMAYDYKMDGCYARADKMAKLLEDRGIIAGKIFVEGVLRPKLDSPKAAPDFFWGWHVAPVLFVRQKDGSKKLMVLDPSISRQPMSVEEFKARMLGSGGPPDARITDSYYAVRYQPHPRKDQRIAATHWGKSMLEEGRSILEDYQKSVDQWNVGSKLERFDDSPLNNPLMNLNFPPPEAGLASSKSEIRSEPMKYVFFILFALSNAAFAETLKGYELSAGHGSLTFTAPISRLEENEDTIYILLVGHQTFFAFPKSNGLRARLEQLVRSGEKVTLKTDAFNARVGDLTLPK